MAERRRRLLVYAALVHFVSAAVSPPLQWINLSKLLSGSAPPALKDASIGYDDTTRTLIIFGGESAGGFPQDATYLLNLDSLTWAFPSPPNGLSQKPAARSQAVSGDDFAASYRNAHVVIGGLGTDGKALSDAWVFDYNNEFWGLVQLSGSGPTVYDAAGGRDLRVAFNPSTTSNTFYLSGGKQSTSSGPASMSDTYSLEISGTLSPNLPNSTTGAWTKQEIGKLKALSGIGSTVIGQKIISYGGCESSASPDVSCATQDAYVLDTSTGGSISPSGCAAPRLNPAIVANMNSASSNFDTQALVMLGIFNTSLWEDGNGLEKGGEVDILDIGGGTWTRVLPSGDPNSSPNYPTPRQGAAALSFTSGLVGSSRSSYSDVIVFGGQDTSGNYLDDVWILRTYSASISSSGQHWSGFGNGNLGSGTSANGQGVTVDFNSTCASRLSTAASPSNTASSTSTTATASGSPSASPSSSPSSSPASDVSFFPYDTAISHKVIGPVSLVLALPAIILYRLSLVPSSGIPIVGYGSSSLRAVAFAMGAAAYGVGVAGFVLAFTSVVAVPRPLNLAKRADSSNTLLKTAHGIAGLVLFLLAYGVLPVLFLFSILRSRISGEEPIKSDDDKAAAQAETASVGTTEKLMGARSPSATGISTGGTRSAVTTPGLDFPPRRFTPQKWPALHRPMLRGRRHSTSSAATEPEPEPTTEPESSGTFEVVNRGHRKRHLSATNTLGAMSESSHRMGRGHATRRSLSDVSWLERRRSVAAVSDLDYALSQLNHNQRRTPTPGAGASMQALNGNPATPPLQAPSMPPATEILLHAALHASLLALTVLSLVALWQRGPIVAFAVFLALTVALYGVFIALAWYGRPANSTLTVFFARVRADGGYTPAPATPMPGDSRPLSPAAPGSSAGPYLNSPPFRSAALQEEDGYVASRHGHLTSEAEGDEDADSDEDEDTRQRRIEEEMARREVSIVTVPKRKLWVVNPS